MQHTTTKIKIEHWLRKKGKGGFGHMKITTNMNIQNIGLGKE